MSEQLQAQLSELLRSLLETTRNASAWTAEQIPPLIAEKILYGRIINTTNMLLGLMFIIVAIVGLAYMNKPGDPYISYGEHHKPRTKWNNNALTSGIVVACTGIFAGGVIGSHMFFINIQHVVKVWFAPRLYIIEWLSSLVK